MLDTAFFRPSPKHKAAIRRYYGSPKSFLVSSRYNNGPKGRLRAYNWRQSPKGKEWERVMSQLKRQRRRERNVCAPQFDY